MWPVHPYRIAPVMPAEPALRAPEPGLRLPFGVMTTLGAVQVASGVLHPAPLQTAFGGACVLAGLAWLVGHRRR
jgi:hypothetical protein